MGEAQVSLEHLFRVFTKPEHKDSKLAQIEQHLSDNILDFLSQHVVTKKTSLEEVEQDFADAAMPESHLQLQVCVCVVSVASGD